MKQPRPRFRWERLVFPAMLFVMLGFFAVTLMDQQARMNSMAQEEEQLNQYLSDLSTERDRLDRMIDYAGTDAYIEQMARDILGWVKKGETRFVAP
ncbi:MAG: FtsB family cell division protein [Christensenellales bacterium]